MNLVEALAAYPEVDSFKEYILADGEDEAAALVEEMGRRLRAAKAEKAKPQRWAADEPKAPTVEQVTKALKKERRGRVGRGESYSPGDLFEALWREQAPRREAEAEVEANRKPATEFERWLANRRAEQFED